MVSNYRALAAGLCAMLAVLSSARESFARPAQPLSDYTITSWSRRDGISGPILSICQDRDGYVWLGTGAGPIRFDGHRFVSWEALGYPPIPARTVISLLSSRDGSLWIGTSDEGVGRLRNGAFTFYRDPDGVAFARKLLEDRHGNVWAGSRSGLYRFDGTRWVLQGASVGLPASPVSGIHEDADGAFWVQTLQGIYRRGASGDAFEPVKETPAFARLLRLPAGPAHPGAQTFAREWNPFRALQDRRGDLWIATIGQGLWRAQTASEHVTIEHATTDTGLSSNVVGAVYEDRESNIWIGTQAGLHKLTSRKVTPVDDLGTVIVVQTTNDGSTWFGSDKGLIRITKERRRTYTERDGLPPGQVRAIFTDRLDRLWIATDLGLARFSDGPPSRPKGASASLAGAFGGGGRFIRVTVPARFDRLISMAVDSHDAAWFSDMRLGVWRLQDGILAQVGAIARLDGRRPASVYVDRSDRVWFGFGDGQLGLLGTDGRISTYPTGITGAITAMSDDSQGVLWLGGGDGIARFSNGKSVAITAGANGLPGSHVTGVIDDGRGAVWAGTGAGIVRVERREFDMVATSRAHTVQCVLYDETDGLRGMPGRLAAPAVARGVDGRLWFVTDGGATMVDPAALPQAQRPPRVRIEEVRAGSTRFDPTGPFRLGPRPERVEIDYTALTFSSAAVRFRYRLSGFDSDWQDAGSRRQASYTNLPPGNYTFQVVARTKEGSTDPSGAVMAFSIQPAFYQTSWFLAGVAAAILGLGMAAWHLRVRQIRQRFSLVLTERTRISREVHDTLLQSLVGVAVRCGTVARRLPPTDSTGARDELTRIRKEVEEQIREVRDTIWNLRSPTLHQRGLAGAIQEAGERLEHQTSVTFTFNIVGRVQSCAQVVEEQLLRIGQEALVNAGRHSGASEVRAELQYDAGTVTLRIVDNGRGFDVDVTGGEDTRHFGLTHMRERAAQAGGHLDVTSGKGSGTQVIASFPTASRGAA